MGKQGKERSPLFPLETWTSVFLGALLLYPLVFGPGGFQTVHETKPAVLVGGCLVYGIVLVLLTAELLLVGRLHPKDLLSLTERWGIPQTAAAVFLLFCALSGFLSSYPEAVWTGGPDGEGLRTILCYAGIFLACSLLGNWRPVHTVLLAVGAAGCGLVGLLQLLGLNPFTLYPEGMTFYDAGILYGSSFLGTVGNASLTAAYFCLAAPALALQWIRKEKGGPVFLGISLLCWLVLCFSGLSGGLAGLAGGAFLMLPLFLRDGCLFRRGAFAAAMACVPLLLRSLISLKMQETLTVSFRFAPAAVLCAGLGVLFLLAGLFLPDRTEKPERPVRTALFLQGGALALGLVFLWFYPGKSGSLWELSRILHGSADDSFGSGRIAIWKDALALFGRSPLLGGGPDSLSYRSSLVFSRVTEDGILLRNVPNNAHNEYLNILINTGLFSLLAYLALLFLPLIRGYRASKNDPSVLYFLAPVLCYAVQALFGYSLCMSAPLFWMFLGLLAGTTRSCRTVFRKDRDAL